MPSPFRSEILSDKFYVFSVLLSLYDICSINGQTSCIPVSQVTKHSRTYVDNVFFENIQPIKYCLRAWFQVIFC